MAKDSGISVVNVDHGIEIDLESMSELIEAQLSEVSGGAFAKSRQFAKSASNVVD